MTDERLEEIEKRLAVLKHYDCDIPTMDVRHVYAEDVRDLLAEVKRLRNDKAKLDAATAAFEEHLDKTWPGHREHKHDGPDR